MNDSQKFQSNKGKRWKFWLIFVATPIIVIICILFAAFYVYIGKDVWKKRDLEQGLVFAKVQRNREALEIFEKELAKNPRNANIHYYMAVSYSNLEDYEKAIAKLETALKIKPDFSDAHILLANISLSKAIELRRLGKAESLVLEKLLEAEDICRAEIERNPNYQNAYTCLGQIHTEQGLIEDAIINYEEALKLDDKLLTAHIAIARLYAQRDKIDLAERHCNLILSEIDHDNYEARMLLSLIYEKQGELDKAVECLTRILKKKPDDLAVHTQLGLFYLKLSKYDEAFNEVQKVRKLSPVILPPLANFIEGCVLFQRKDYKNAIVSLKEVTEKIPDFIQPHYVLALALIENRQLEEARFEFKTTIGLSPEFIPAQIGLMRLLEKEGNYNEIVRLSKDVLAMEPENLNIMQILGNTYVNLRDFKSAEAVFQKILELKPSIGNIKMAGFSLATGQLGKCIRQCEEIIKSNPDEARAYDILGLAYLREGNFEECIKQFEKAIEKNQRMVDAHLNLTRAYIVTGRNKDAIKTLEDLISFDPNNLQANTLLTSLYEKEGNIDKAINILVNVMAIEPEYLPGYKVAGLYLLNGMADEAVDICNRALKLAPEDADFHINLAVAHQDKGEYTQSILSCQEAGKQKQLKPFLNILMANIHTANGDFDKAADYFLKGSEAFERKEYTNAVALLKKVTDRLPGSAQAHYILAIALMESGNIKKAKAEFTTTLDLAPGFIPAQIGLAKLLFRSGWYREAIRLAKNILDIESDNLEVMCLIGKSYMKLEDFEDAELIFKKIIKLDPLIGKIYMAHLSLASGQLSKCIKECEQIIRTDPEELKVYDILGLAYVRQGNFDKGIEQFAKAIGKNQNKADTHLNLAKAYVVTGRNNDAINTLEILISFNPINLEANTILANLYEGDGRIDDAADLLERVLEIDPEYLPAYKLASLRLWQGRADDAIDLCNRALKLTAENVMFHINLAIAYQEKEKYHESISLFKNAGDLSSDIPLFDMFMTNIYVSNDDFYKARKQVESSLIFNDEEKKEYLKLVDLCQKNKKDSKKVTLNLNKALAAKQMCNFDLAISESKKALAIFPQTLIPEMLIEHGEEEAVSIYQRLAGKDDESISVRLSLANQLFKKGSIHETAKITEETMELYPEDLSSYNLLEELFIRDTKDTKHKDSTHGYYDMVRLKFTNEQVESLSMFNDAEKKEYLGLIEICKDNEKKGKQVTLSINKYIVAIQSGYFSLAIKECEKAAKILPDNLVPKIFLASTYLSANKKEEAIKVYNEIIERKPEYVSQDMGKAYLAAQKEEDAISTYQNLADLDNNSVSTRLILAGLLFKKNSVEDAVKLVDEAIQLSPENLRAHNLLGELNLASTRYENAEMAFSKMLELDVNTFEGHYNMARLKFAQNEIDECIRYCKKSLEIKPAEIRVLTVLGAAYLRKGMLSNAVLVFNKIIDINSKFVPAHLNIANIKLQLNQPEIALPHYKTALRIDPQNNVARLGLGSAYALIGKHKEAIVEFETLNKTEPENVAVYFNMIKSYLAMDQDDKAHDALVKVLELDPENQTASLLMSKVYVKNEEISKAIEQLSFVLQHNPESSDAYGLGILYLDRGEYENSISTYKQGINNFPNNVFFLCSLSIAHLMNEDYDGAIDACSKAINIQPGGIIPNLCMIIISLSKDDFEGARRHISNESLRLNNMQKESLMGLINFSENNKLTSKIVYHLGRSIAYANSKWLNRVLKEHDKISEIAITDASLYQILADILVWSGGVDEAIEIYKRALEMAPDSPSVYYQLANIYARNARNDEAETLYKKLISIDPDNVIAHLKLAMILQSNGLINEAVKEYEMVIKLEPSSIFAHNNLAYLYATKLQGKIDYAMKFAKDARELAPKNANILDTYGWICYLNGEYDKSIAELKNAVKISPRNPTMRYHLGVVYYKTGLELLALKELEYALRLSSNFPEAEKTGKLIEKISFY
ncbi:hypothetical protein SCALIN_C13_0173 [Candidatus Scalindua japonica]|uniref:Tetratricopeptide repeat protein 21A/21B C-terminal ARM domain-containing protein n=1 Tax=Candidatus Scalindua japonica TaxID=1284222 RepID=A0A286TXP2_9BACT|nr:tetratricopeptide repeat protein [Candidatus Scalindua japonica]GAX60658.1 hypothetical protein SCALIN_C13_0173 [Candidatus Scalindua japonica]